VNRAGPSAAPDTGRTPHPGGEVRDVKVPRRISSTFRALPRWSAVTAAAGHPHSLQKASLPHISWGLRGTAMLPNALNANQSHESHQNHQIPRIHLISPLHNWLYSLVSLCFQRIGSGRRLACQA
jgi:hypothetical protein